MSLEAKPGKQMKYKRHLFIFMRTSINLNFSPYLSLVTKSVTAMSQTSYQQDQWGYVYCLTNEGFPTMDELNIRTQKKKDHCIQQGYIYVEIWECEWDTCINDPVKLEEFIERIKCTLNLTV